jgi:hypothetical protein
MKVPLLYISLGVGIAACVIIILGVLPPMNESIGDGIFCCIPLAVLGLVTGIISLFRYQNKKLAKIVIGINLLPIAFLLLIIFLFIHAGPNAFKQ